MINRAERRRMKKEGVAQEKINNMTENSIYKAGFQAGMREAIDITFYMTADVLNYKLGFGRKRLQRIMFAIYNNIDSFRTGHLTAPDFDAIKQNIEKMGVKMR